MSVAIRADLEGRYGQERGAEFIRIPTTKRPPCDGCAHAARCRADSLACRDFSTFVHSNRTIDRDRVPTGRIFAALFGVAA